jgi:predicted transcriptional regulator
MRLPSMTCRAAFASRAPRSEGPRTTLRLPAALADVADRLAREVDISRNDALLRLATRGARLYELEQSIAARRQERWAAVVPGVFDIDRVELPTLDEVREAIFAVSDDSPAAPAV